MLEPHRNSYTFVKDKNNKFIYNDKSCLLSILSIHVNDLLKLSDVYLTINDVKIYPTCITSNNDESKHKTIMWEFSTIRDNLRNIILPESEEEQLLLRLENTFKYNSLKAISFIKNVSIQETQNCIFTLDLQIELNFTSRKKIDTIDAFQTYYI
jgi:hypothetical protein